jgi:hypothetical protein
MRIDDVLKVGAQTVAAIAEELGEKADSVLKDAHARQGHAVRVHHDQRRRHPPGGSRRTPSG